ncbi:nucleotidyl transferase AbiEii/AbiGii toxin family protein [Candidatus Uhrbacteria bacterium]|nr:nucleotidyl transferase AbiEii/AbiGii toxin family protein [Candidatus Uhrbacteria bacterium]
MHKEILTAQQRRLLPALAFFKKDFYLVGGTALALYLGHRRSIDFDLFSRKEFSNKKIEKILFKETKIRQTVRDEDGEYTIIVNGVQLTFVHYPFNVSATHWFGRVIKMPDILAITAMKAYALGRRAKWKDYVDLYFVMRKYHGIAIIEKEAEKIFGSMFNAKLFREQVSYFDDINYEEKVIFMPGFKVSDAAIKKGLVEYSIK